MRRRVDLFKRMRSPFEENRINFIRACLLSLHVKNIGSETQALRVDDQNLIDDDDERTAPTRLNESRSPSNMEIASRLSRYIKYHWWEESFSEERFFPIRRRFFRMHNHLNSPRQSDKRIVTEKSRTSMSNRIDQRDSYVLLSMRSNCFYWQLDNVDWSETDQREWHVSNELEEKWPSFIHCY